ncbi:hypothetical protein F4814DRAFT_453750 [Daldinia grandis]|nr:hypothetical protein F4814DRAFT_453750 [Daldinia grandis]
MPTLTTRLPFSRTISTNESTDSTAAVYPRTFPLQLTAAPDESGGVDMATATATATATALRDEASSASPVSALPGGVIAAIEIGATVCVLAVLCGAIMLSRHRWRKMRADGGGES